MKPFESILFLLFPVVLAVPTHFSLDDGDIEDFRYLVTQDDSGNIKIEDLLLQEIQLQASEKDVTFRVYTRNNPKDGEIVTNDNITKSINYDSKKRTLVVTHGWRNDYTSPLNTEITRAVLELQDINIIIVDWSDPANRNYITAQGSVAVIGETVGKFINNLVQNLSVPLSQVNLIGHSLGAHVAGNAGAAVKGDVDWIIGLDPARPLFTYANIANRLDPTDADYVYIIHTSGGLLGFQKPIGDCDFFPNGGEHQPGCGLDPAGTCGHSRAYEYYVESLKSPEFIARECDSLSNYRKGKCKDNRSSIMGEWERNKELKGSFYLETNSKPPYAKGE